MIRHALLLFCYRHALIVIQNRDFNFTPAILQKTIWSPRPTLRIFETWNSPKISKRQNPYSI